MIFASSGKGKIHSQGTRKVEKKRLSLDEVEHLNVGNPSEEGR